MSRRTQTIVGALALTVAAGGAWWWSRTSAVDDAPVEVVDADAQLVRDKWEARRAAGDEQAPCSARGRVSRVSDGTGVANAALTFVRPQIIASPEPVVVQTDASGDWSVEGLAPGRYDITVTSADLRPAILRGVVLSPGKDHPNVDHVLEPGGTPVSGTITDPSGKPVAGARFQAIRTIDEAGGWPAAYMTLSDAQGRYAMRLDDEHYVVGVTHRDHVRVRGHMTITDTPRTRDFRLVPGGVVIGRVVSRVDGTPVAGAVLRVHDPGTLSSNNTANYETRAVTDADGQFEMTGLPAGVVTLVVTAPGWTNVELTSVPLGVAERVENVEVLADPAHRIAGFFVAADDETAGVRDVSLIALDMANPGKIRISEPSQADGYFTVHGVPPGQYWLIVWGTDVVPSFDQMVEVTDHDVDDHLIRVERGHTLRGRVQPGADVIVHAAVSSDFSQVGWLDMRRMLKTMMSTFRVVRPRPDGSFELASMAAGRYTLHARGAGGQRGSVEVEMGDVDLDGPTIPLVDGVRVSGRVHDDRGRPVQGMTVSIAAVKARTISMSSMFTGSGLTAVTDEHGRFEIAGLEAGEYDYEVNDDLGLGIPWAEPEDSDSPTHTRRLELARDRELDIEVVSSRPLVGRVVDEHGAPIASAWIVAWPDIAMDEVANGFGAGLGVSKGPNTQLPEPLGREMARKIAPAYALPAVLSDAQGRFTIENTWRARYTVTAQAARGQLVARYENVSPAEPLEITLQPVGGVHVQLGGAPPGGGLSVLVEGPETRRVQLRGTTDVVIDRLTPGHWRLVVEAPGGVASGDVDVVAGETIETELELAGWASVTGTIVDRRTRKPIGGMQAMIERKLQSADEVMEMGMESMALLQGGGKHPVDGEGRFEIGRLAPGPVTVDFVAVPSLEVQAQLRVSDLKAAEVRDVGEVVGLVLDDVPKEERGWFGVRTNDEGSPGQPAPLVVSDVEPGSPAAAAGVRNGDIVLRIDDAEVAELGAEVVNNLISRRHVRIGDTREVLLRRVDGSTHTVRLRAAKPSSTAPP